jgi:phosphatidylinositol-4-phosphate 3-kinase
LSVQLNFIVHSLAQLRFTGDHNDNQRLLSFVPKTCTRETESRILSCAIVAYFKKYDPEKEYFFVVRVTREDCQKDPQRVSRSYQEFYEFYQKLSSLFPLAPINLSRGSSFGRSNTQEMAEKRKNLINSFLRQLTMCTEEISHSDLVYTFFQPLLRDQELEEMMVSGNSMYVNRQKREKALSISKSNCPTTGQVSLSVTYKNNSLGILIRHAKGLVSKVSPEKQPNTYVKTKLTPDPRNDSKRKTKIVNRNSNPSFMELIVYCLPLSSLQQKVLNVSVWESASTVHGSIYLGAAFIPLGELDLSHDSVSWYPLN